MKARNLLVAVVIALLITLNASIALADVPGGPGGLCSQCLQFCTDWWTGCGLHLELCIQDCWITHCA
jgi:hypothetical protein